LISSHVGKKHCKLNSCVKIISGKKKQLREEILLKGIPNFMPQQHHSRQHHLKRKKKKNTIAAPTMKRKHYTSTLVMGPWNQNRAWSTQAPTLSNSTPPTRTAV